MIYMRSAFKNYEEFKALFGVNEHGNGEKSRRNKILLSLFKSKEILHRMATRRERYHLCQQNEWNPKEEKYVPCERWRCEVLNRWDIDLYAPLNMSGLYRMVMDYLSVESRGHSCTSWLQINNLDGIWSTQYKSDDFGGLCEDGDIRSIRYINIENGRVFKMRAGKFMRKLIEECNDLNTILPYEVKNWFCEEFAEKWKAYAADNICGNEYTLHVDDDFCRIYDSYECVGDFGSCMTDKDYWTFYRDATDAKAAYLENEDGKIVARCIIYTDVLDGEGNHLRLAERQYSTDCDDSLKRMLVMRLIDGGHIDGYKRVGADCHSPESFANVHGEPLKNYELSIRCVLHTDDAVSYQDSFKWYDEDNFRAYNHDFDGYHEDDLATTDGYWGSRYVYSEYHGRNIREDDAVYVETRDTYILNEETREARVYHRGEFRWETCLADDCLEIYGCYYYAGTDAEYPEEYGISTCPVCGENFVYDEGCYSEITCEDYCCADCRNSAERDYKKENWTYSSWDDDYFEDENEVDEMMFWNKVNKRYERFTIHIDTLQELIDDGDVIWFNGMYYHDACLIDGEPAHACAA